MKTRSKLGETFAAAADASGAHSPGVGRSSVPKTTGELAGNESRDLPLPTLPGLGDLPTGGQAKMQWDRYYVSGGLPFLEFSCVIAKTDWLQLQTGVGFHERNETGLAPKLELALRVDKDGLGFGRMGIGVDAKGAYLVGALEIPFKLPTDRGETASITLRGTLGLNDADRVFTPGIGLTFQLGQDR